MQLAEGDSRASESSEQFLSPGKAFALLFGVILLLGGTIFLLRPDPPAQPTAMSDPPAPTFELTDDEAITRFEQLQSLRNQAFEARDPSLLTVLYTTDSRVAEIAADEIQTLTESNVLDQSKYVTRKLTVISNASDEIRLREVVVIYPKFVTESGRDVTKQSKPVRRVGEWTLRVQNGQWLIFDALVTDSEILR